MRIKIDENLPSDISDLLNLLGHDAHTTVEEGLNGADDSDVWATAQKEERFLITKDFDFSDLRSFVPGRHAGILLLRLGDAGRNSLIRCVKQLFENEDVESWHRCVVVSTERKVRIRRPPLPPESS